jgi:hypothetical protein
MTTAISITVQGSLMIRRSGGRTIVIAPDGQPLWAPPRAWIDDTMVKALARALRWRMLETGAVTGVREIAAAEKINKSYFSRVLRLTLLARQIVEAILDGRQMPEMTLPRLMKGVAVECVRGTAPPLMYRVLHETSDVALAGRKSVAAGCVHLSVVSSRRRTSEC